MHEPGSAASEYVQEAAGEARRLATQLGRGRLIAAEYSAALRDLGTAADAWSLTH